MSLETQIEVITYAILRHPKHKYMSCLTQMSVKEDVLRGVIHREM